MALAGRSRADNEVTGTVISIRKQLLFYQKEDLRDNIVFETSPY